MKQNTLLIISFIAAFIFIISVSLSKSTIYDMVNLPTKSLNQKIIHFKINGQSVDMFIAKNNDNGALLSKERGSYPLPFYRDRNGGLCVHFKGIDKNHINKNGSLFALIEPVIGFNNLKSGSTQYVSIRSGNDFDPVAFLNDDQPDNNIIPRYPGSQKVNVIETKNMSIGHYNVFVTNINAIMLFFNMKFRSMGYNRLRAEGNFIMYQGNSMYLTVYAKEEEGHVSIVTYAVKEK